MWINAGYFVCEPEVFDYITEGDQTIFERSPLENLAKDGKMTSFKHTGFWKPMDILRDNKEEWKERRVDRDGLMDGWTDG